MRRAGIAETFMGILILAVLAAIAGGVYIVQSRFDPALYRVSLPTESGVGRSVRSGNVPPAPAFLPQSLVPLGPEETFDSETLSDKIDGRAELYLSSGFVKLSARRFGSRAEPKKWLELYIYQMKDPAGAFSVYSVQRRKDSRPVDLGASGYATKDAIFFTNGPKYFEIISSSGDMAEAMTALAKNIVKAEPGYAKRETESSLFPPESLDKSSISLQLKDVFGFSGLDRVYTAGYAAGNGQVTAFISKRKDPEEAAGLAAAYGRFLLENGGARAGEMQGAPGSKIYKVFDTYEIVMCRGKFFAGVHEVDNLENAKEIASRMYRKLSEAVR